MGEVVDFYTRGIFDPEVITLRTARFTRRDLRAGWHEAGRRHLPFEEHERAFKIDCEDAAYELCVLGRDREQRPAEADAAFLRLAIMARFRSSEGAVGA